MSVRDFYPTWKWIVGILMGVVLGFLSYESQKTEARFLRLESIDSTSLQDRSELKAHYQDISGKLDRIENMLTQHILPGIK